MTYSTWPEEESARMVRENDTLRRRQFKLRGAILEATRDLNALEKNVRHHAGDDLVRSAIADDIHRISQKLYPSDLIGD